MAAQPTRYQQIADDLRRPIESREFTPDTSLPTEVELQDAVSSIPQHRSGKRVKILVQQRLLETSAGQGTFITKEMSRLSPRCRPIPKTGIERHGGEGTNYPRARPRAGPGSRRWRSGSRLFSGARADRGTARDRSRASTLSAGTRSDHIDGQSGHCRPRTTRCSWVDRGATAADTPDDIPEGAVEYLAAASASSRSATGTCISARLPDDSEQRSST